MRPLKFAMTTLYKGSCLKMRGGVEVQETGAGAKWAVDCPLCKFGTLESSGNGAMFCIDCGHIPAPEQLDKLIPARKVRNSYLSYRELLRQKKTVRR